MSSHYKKVIITFIVFAALFQLYLYTAFPAFKNNDSPETMTAAYTLGIGHPPGYPLFTMAAKIFTFIPVGSPAFRINIFSSFLAMLVLLVSYLVIKRNILIVLGYENKIINFYSIFILAFSYIFWNQAIEAKGGIYILNLLFLVVLIYLSLHLFNNFSKKHLYLMSYILGLSLSNHWPSMIILMPVFAYVYFKHKKDLSKMSVLLNILFLLLGMSAYVYLPVRSMTDDIFIFMAPPNNWRDFWWTVFRSGYTYSVSATTEMYKNQISEFLQLFINNYGFFWPFIFFGIYTLMKQNRLIANFYLTIFAVISIIVVFFNRSIKEIIWVVDIFLIPAQYILYIFIVIGTCFVFKLIKRRVLKYAFLTVLALTIAYLGYRNFNQNNSRSNYISYDFGHNIVKTIEPGSFYLPESDYHNMPMSYLNRIEAKGNDIKYISLFSLQYDWGIQKFIKKFGNFDFQGNHGEKNVLKIIETFALHNNIYFSNFVKNIEQNELNYQLKNKGVLFKTVNRDAFVPAAIFDCYVYRGLFNTKTQYDYDLASLYGGGLASQAEFFLKEKRYYEAINTYKKALLLPNKINKGDIYLNMAIAYKYVLDTDNELESLNRALKYKRDFGSAFEEAGFIYYRYKMFPIAKEYLENALKYGSANEPAVQAYLQLIAKTDINEQHQMLYDRAVTYLSDGFYDKAMDMFGYFIRKRMLLDKIYRNIAVYNLKNNNFYEATKYFVMVNEVEKTRDSFSDLAFCYYKSGNINKALAELKRGLSLHKNDVVLLNMQDQLINIKENTNKQK